MDRLGNKSATSSVPSESATAAPCQPATCTRNFPTFLRALRDVPIVHSNTQKQMSVSKVKGAKKNRKLIVKTY